ncbi:phosphotransferase family protein [Micromonospora sp. NPDC050187]|uniref:phosphotransferase family protein n=1 Tax=Micromonospora sp. NPDC050187 TaxID=3364277 RepID=UPI00379B47F6
MLTAEEVPGYLIARGLVAPRTLVDGDLVVRDLSSRNRTFAVECRSGTGYLLKQDRDPRTTGCAHEAEVYRILSGDRRMRVRVPRCHGYDTGARVLVLEHLRDAVDLGSPRRRRPSVRVAAEIGAVLAALHATPTSKADELATPAARPPALRLHRPDLAFFCAAAGSTLRLVRIVQQTSGFAQLLDEVGRDWTPSALVHGDVRWTNLMVDARRPRLRLVDWELAGRGDPRWDIGSALGNYLGLWLAALPVTGTVAPARNPTPERRLLEQVQAAVRACWNSYVRTLDPDPDVAGRMLPGTVRFAAARLLQTVLETADNRVALTGDLVLHLQVVLNMLECPAEAAVHLLGLPLSALPRPARSTA